jgi:hypothetical protein
VGLGVWGLLGALTLEHYEDVGPRLGLAIVGGIFGLIVFIVGMVKGGGEEQSSSPDSFYKRPQAESLCRNCGRLVVDGDKTCRRCGADLK